MIKPDAKSRSSREGLKEPSVVERLWYLLPSRYFRFFFLYDRRNHKSCWVPEGFSQ